MVEVESDVKVIRYKSRRIEETATPAESTLGVKRRNSCELVEACEELI